MSETSEAIGVGLLAVVILLYYIFRAVSQVAQAIVSLEMCIRQTAEEFKPKSETKRTLEWMEKVGFGDAAVKRDVP